MCVMSEGHTALLMSGGRYTHMSQQTDGPIHECWVRLGNELLGEYSPQKHCSMTLVSRATNCVKHSIKGVSSMTKPPLLL